MRFAAPLLVLALSACASAEPFDYSLFHAHQPRSVLILPPLDNSMEVEAAYAYLSTLTEPIAERGYYVFPVAVVDGLLRDNGLPGPGGMHQAPLQRLGEVFGADAVLCIALPDGGTHDHVIDSTTPLTDEASLVDVASATEIWHGKNSAAYSSSSGGGGIADMLVGALVNQVMSSVYDPSLD